MTLNRFTSVRPSGRLFILLLLLLLVACNSGTGVDEQFPTLSWNPPSERENGFPIALSEIAGYRVYYGVSADEYPHRFDITDGTAVQTKIQSLPPGDYVFVITTLDTSGQESRYSEEVSVSIRNGE
jgi:hypothetical protein